jgi:serine/threonine protein kinase
MSAVDRCYFRENDAIDDKYVVVRAKKDQVELGEGSFGVVYKVKERNNSNYFALKLLRLWEIPPDVRNSLIERFDMEFETGQIRSKYLVQSCDHGIIKGNPYIVMEYCPNGDVTRLIEKPDCDLIKIGRHILYGLKDLHSCGKVHRDLKPENVLIKEDGAVALTDFGISGDRNKRMTERNLLGKPRQIFGTYAYMPPEQVKPKRGEATVLPTTDIFSYGVLMYQLITQELPFGRLEDENDLVVYLKRGREGDWNRQTLKQFNKHNFFNAVIEGCLVPEYKERLQTVDEILSHFPANLSSTYKPSVSGSSYQREVVKGVLLRVMQGEDHGAVYKLNDSLESGKRMLTVGRLEPGNDNSISIKEEQSCYISRRHCTLEWDVRTGVWCVRDGQWNKTEGRWKASTNGTYVNSQEISVSGTYYFYPGDILTIGDTKLRAEGY